MQEVYADIIVDITSQALDRPFSYKIPDALTDVTQPGVVVEVPFGAGDRLIRGYVIRLTETTAVPEDRIKEIRSVVTEGLGATERLVCLAAWMRSRYGCTMAQALRTVIPIKKKVKGKEKEILTLTLNAEQAKRRLELYRKKHQTARERLLTALMDTPQLPRDLVSEKLNITAPVIRALAEQGVLEIRKERIWRMPEVDSDAQAKQLILTQQQMQAADGIWQAWEDGRETVSLLHGVTGSGKTAVYMELIARTVARGQQAIVLIPEIALTWQTVMRFYHRFGAQVSRIHSRLSAGEKQDQFEQAKNGGISIMIGPRSALFTPFPDLGLIIIDEEHEGAYQSEQSPRYHAVETALQRAKLEKAHVLLGSATPSLDSYYHALQGTYGLYTLTERAGSAELPEVEIVDMREELRGGNRSPFSMSLQEKMAAALKNGEQIMLFLNRRGLAAAYTCRSCGKAVRCPHCDVTLTLHRGGRLVCHYCGYETPAMKCCPDCGSGMIGPMKAGTQQIEQEVSRLFPNAGILRMDLDTTRGKDDYTKLLSAFQDRKADVLIGTQMIVKGHDFPGVTVMGVLAADLSLYAADFRSSEKTFQLLTQAVGRAGRADTPGYAVIQTYDPDHYAIRCAASQDYQSFYEQEISMRRMSMYPPVGAMTALHLSEADEAHLTMAAEYLGKYARHIAKRYHAAVLGPVDEPIAKIADQYKKVLYLKADSSRRLTDMREKLDQYIEMNSGFAHILITAEVV